jgi:hypothetical protein
LIDLTRKIAGAAVELPASGHVGNRHSRLRFLGGFPWAIIALPACFVVIGSGAAVPVGQAERPKVLVHYMTWFSAKPAAPAWGWHWTMNAFDPDKVAGGKRPIASHYYPLIGPYDSGDPTVIEYHFQLMKLAGFDGIIADCYGLSNLFDYPILHRNRAALFPAAARVGLKIGICYEDQTISKLVEAKKIAEGDRVKHASEVLAWLQKNWFAEPHYLSRDGRPVLLSFGSTGLTDREWEQVLRQSADATIYLSEHRRRPAAAGAFDWPVPSEGLARLDRFAEAGRGWPVMMPAAFPRFHDVYAEAKVHESYGRIPDDEGNTFTSTLKRAITSRAPFVQVVTWNDWGEGTAIEPSVEFGYRDLESMQRLRRELIDPAFAPSPTDLRLAHRLYLLRRKEVVRPGLNKTLDEVARLLSVSQLSAARDALNRAETDNR